ncbi:hypothetical protein [Glycomyces albidus]|nr:hypothetical protein [Glycomyces albidus]
MGGLAATVCGLDAPFLLSAVFGITGIALWLRRGGRLRGTALTAPA